MFKVTVPKIKVVFFKVKCHTALVPMIGRGVGWGWRACSHNMGNMGRASCQITTLLFFSKAQPK